METSLLSREKGHALRKSSQTQEGSEEDPEACFHVPQSSRKGIAFEEAE